MNGKEFQPKAFYRKLDSLLARISRASAKDLNIVAFDELTQSFGRELNIRSGCLYMLRRGTFEMVKAPIGDTRDTWPDSFPLMHEAIALLMQHKSYIFTDTAEPPWGNNSVAVLVGEEDQFLMAFKLNPGWEREILELSLNTIRNTLNYIRSTQHFGAVFQEAYEIQKRSLPRIDPEFEGYDIAGRSVPAELVGGDLYDYHLLDKKIIGIAIGDASGHGLPAALLARDVLTGLRMGVARELKLSGLITKLNRVINSSSLSSRFISLVYGELEKNGTFVYVNAGHNRPLLLKKSEVQELDVGGTILGPIAETTFRRGFAFIDAGDIMLFYTDGMIEREDLKGEPFGKERLIQFVRSMSQESSLRIIEKLFEHLYHFGANERWQDDATAIVVKRIK